MSHGGGEGQEHLPKPKIVIFLAKGKFRRSRNFLTFPPHFFCPECIWRIPVEKKPAAGKTKFEPYVSPPQVKNFGILYAIFRNFRLRRLCENGKWDMSHGGGGLWDRDTYQKNLCRAAPISRSKSFSSLTRTLFSQTPLIISFTMLRRTLPFRPKLTFLRPSLDQTPPPLRPSLDQN